MLFHLKFIYSNFLFLKKEFRKDYKTECLMIILGKPTKDGQDRINYFNFTQTLLRDTFYMRMHL